MRLRGSSRSSLFSPAAHATPPRPTLPPQTAIKRALQIPVIANGGIETLADAEECLRVTRCDAVMASEGLLADPWMFARGGALSAGAAASKALAPAAEDALPPSSAAGGRGGAQPGPGKDALAARYLDLVTEHLPAVGLSCARAHLFKMLYEALQLPGHEDLRTRLHQATDLAQMREVAAELRDRDWVARVPEADTGAGAGASAPGGTAGWYWRHRTAPDSSEILEEERRVNEMHAAVDEMMGGGCVANMFGGDEGGGGDY